MEQSRVALITGGTSGLGYELVKTFLEAGWEVATCGRRKAIIDRLKSEGADNFVADVCDISIDSSVAVFLREVEEKFGRIDLLVLNAASLGPVPLPLISDISIKDLRMTFETNFFGNFQFLKRALPLMKKNGKIIHITSDAATTPYKGWGAYASSKAAFDMIIKILNTELSSDKITAAVFDPGDMDTEMHRRAIPSDASSLKDPRDAARDLYFRIVEKGGILND